MYVYAAAMAGRAGEQGWTDYRQWAQWLWSGQLEPLLQALAARGQALGPPGDDEAETSPRRLVADACRYVSNQRSRMDYAEYRRLGLPITSSHIESTIKQINRRMKGSEKFWDQGAEPLLQLTADYLSQTTELSRFWKQRPSRLASTRAQQTAA